MQIMRPEATRTATPSKAKKAPAVSPMQRADELLHQMTLEEKAMQLSSVFPLALFDIQGPNPRQLEALLKNGIGHVSALGLIGYKTPETLAKSVNPSSATCSRRRDSRSPPSFTMRR
jgi:hypothetical protein